MRVHRFALACLLACNVPQLMAQVSLPSQRVEYYGVFTNAAVEATVSAPYPGIRDDDSEMDADEVLSYIDVHAFAYDAARGVAEATISIEGSISSAELATDWAPTADASIQTLSDAEAYSHPMETTAAGFQEDAFVDAYAQYEVIENPNSPGTGTTANSATLSSSLWLVLSGPLDSGEFNSMSFKVTVGGSDLDITSLDPYGSTWEIDGELTQSSSTNPTAAALPVSDTFIDGFNEFYEGTQATSVGETVYVRGMISVSDVDVYTQNPNGPQTGIHQQSMKASGWYEVEVP